MSITNTKVKKNSAERLVNSSVPLTITVRLTWFIVAILSWCVVTYFHLVSSLIIPSPYSVFIAAKNIGPDVFFHSATTLARGLGGFILGSMIGVALGSLVQYNRIAQLIAEPMLDASRPVPALALLPFFILIFGFSELGRALLIVLNVTIFISLTTVESIAKVPEPWVRFSRISGLSRIGIFYRILLPGAIPWLSGPFRLGLALSFTLTIAAEFMGAQYGLGFLINTARVNLATPTIWLSIILLGLVCQISDSILVSIFNRLTFWYQTSS